MKSITLTREDQQLKDMLKQAMLELMEERQKLFLQIVTEVLEETSRVSEKQTQEEKPRHQTRQRGIDTSPTLGYISGWDTLFCPLPSDFCL
jgi:hypothetical protein